MNRITFIAALWLSSLCFASDDADDQKPDLSKLDRATLQVLAEQLYDRVTQLEAEVEELKAQIGGEHGGAIAQVDGDTVSVDDGSWVVTIVSNTQSDTSALESRLQAERQKLKRIDDRLTNAREALSLAQKSHRNDRDANQNKIATERATARERSVVKRLEGQQRGLTGRITQLERKLSQESRERTIMAVTEDGMPCQIIARGVYAAVGSTLDVDTPYKVTGRGQFGDTDGKIYLKSAVPVATAAVVAGE